MWIMNVHNLSAANVAFDRPSPVLGFQFSLVSLRSMRQSDVMPSGEILDPHDNDLIDFLCLSVSQHMAGSVSNTPCRILLELLDQFLELRRGTDTSVPHRRPFPLDGSNLD